MAVRRVLRTGAALVLIVCAAPACIEALTMQLTTSVVQLSSPDSLVKIDPMLLRLTGSPSRLPVIVRARDAASLPSVLLLAQQLGGTLGRQLPIIDSVAVSFPVASLPTLAGSAFVSRIVLDRPVQSANERTGATVGAIAVRQELGYDGSGVGVAVVDSGVTTWHDDLGATRVERFVDLINGRPLPYDDYGHGTHVAGIIAGSGYDSGGARAGIAPGAHLLVVKVLDGAGRGRISDVIGGIDYVVAHRSELNIRVINLSLGAGVFESYNTDVLTVAARRAVEAGIVVVASAGNAGRDSAGRTQYGAITSPGNAPWVFTVGASSHMGTIDRSDDTMASFSSRGPTAIDRAAKPDLVAPGVGIESLSAPESAMFVTMAPLLLPGSVAAPSLPYLSLSGTSQAAPVVTGTIALMLQANPTLTPNAVKAILQFTAQPYPRYDGLTEGAGFVNAAGAVQLARAFTQSEETADTLPADWSGQIFWGNRRVKGGRLTAAANAWRPDVSWGALVTPNGEPIDWGTTCIPADCGPASVWTTWGIACAQADCVATSWGALSAVNVVWRMTCGGADCAGVPWAPDSGSDGTAGGETVVWGTSDGGPTVVWGTSDNGETVVWGSNDNGETVVWGTNDGGETVVWGTSADDQVVWQGCTDSCGGGKGSR